MPPKKWVEIFLVPLVIAMVGIMGTFAITRSQLQSSERIATASLDAENQRAQSEQRLKALEMFSSDIKDPHPEKRVMALRILGALEPELAEKLAKVVEENDDDTAVKKVAATVVQASKAIGNSFAVIGSYRTLQEAQDALNGYLSRPPISSYKPEIYLASNGYYALTIGGHLSFAEATARVQSARSVIPGAYVRVTDLWGTNLLQ